MVSKGRDLIPAQRRALLLEHLREQGAASIQALSQSISVSASTIRRDLEELEQSGYLERTRGGAMVERTRKSTFEPTADLAAEISRPQKHAIGALAATLVSRGDSIIFDSSTTVLEAARLIAAGDMPLTAVTNDLGIGAVLAANASVSVVVPGGTVRHGSLTLRGEPGQQFFQTIHADIALIGTHSIADGFLSETSLEIATLKRLMIGAARRVILLADSSKFQAAAFCRICALADLDEIITDRRLREEDAQMLDDAGVLVRIADQGI